MAIAFSPRRATRHRPWFSQLAELNGDSPNRRVRGFSGRRHGLTACLRAVSRPQQRVVDGA